MDATKDAIMKTWPKLYKLDNKGKIRVWWIEAIESIDGDPPAYYQNHGVLDGKIQRTSTYITEGKNKGKSNATTSWEQCCLEAESLWTKQRDRKGYTETIPSAKPFGPMLAKSYDKDGHHIKFPCYVQPKLDGLRCLAIVKDGKVELRSRQNKVFKVLDHIEKELYQFPDGVYDGELYAHDVSFQDIVSGIKRDEKNDLTAKIEYWIYDIVNEDNNKLRQITISELPFNNIIKRVATIDTADETFLDKFHSHFTNMGFEGIMVRNWNGLYKVNGRSADLQKYKKFMDEEFEIFDAEENKGKLAGSCVFHCKTKDGGTFKVMPEGSESQRKKYWTDWNSGKIKSGMMATVEFFSYTTSIPKIPRFPIMKTIRDYE